MNRIASKIIRQYSKGHDLISYSRDYLAHADKDRYQLVISIECHNPFQFDEIRKYFNSEVTMLNYIARDCVRRGISEDDLITVVYSYLPN